MSFDEKQKEFLLADLSVDAIRTRSQSVGNGKEITLSYLEGWYVIDRANEIFGFDGWSYEIVDLVQAHLHDGPQKSSAAYFARVRVTVGDVVREDVGTGTGFAKSPGRVGDSVEGAVKEAVTDALKRALRSFGNQFGNALYDKRGANVEGTPANIQKMRDRAMQPLSDELEAEIDSSDSVAALDILLKERVDDFRSLPDAMKNALRIRADAKKRELKSGPQVSAGDVAA